MVATTLPMKKKRRGKVVVAATATAAVVLSNVIPRQQSRQTKWMKREREREKRQLATDASMVTIPFVWLQLVEAKQHYQQWQTFYPIEESFIKWVHVTFSHQSVTHIAHHMSNAIKRLHLSTLNLNILKFNYHNHKYGNIKKRSLFIWGRFIYLWLIDWLIDLMEFSIHSKPITASTRVCVCA